MKSKDSRGARVPKIVLAATVLAAPVVAATPAAAQRPTSVARPPALRPILLKFPSPVVVAGEIGGRTVFKSSAGTLFYVDPKTGDERVVARAYASKALKHAAWKTTAYPIEHGTVPVTIVGLDAKGHTVMQDAKGEQFYLDAKTGDMVFMK